MTQLGGVDVILTDGAPAILTAVKALRSDVILIQHIHSGDGKRARLIKLTTIPNRKAMEQTTMELHTGSLLLNTESIATVSKKKIYPKNLSGTSKVEKGIQPDLTDSKELIDRKGVLTPEESSPITKKSAKRPSKLLKGHKINLNTGPTISMFELSYLDPLSLSTEKLTPTLLELHEMVLLTQTVLPYQFITSNRAETFNALHDHFQSYWGNKSFYHANRDLLAWAVMKFYPTAAKRLIQSHHWHVPYTLLKQLWPFLISEVKLP